MLLLGEIEKKRQAKRFSTYLLSQGINNKVDKHGQVYEVWIEKRGQLEQAKAEFEAFKQDPQAQRFGAQPDWGAEKKKTRRIKAGYRKNFKSAYRGNTITLVLIVLSVAVYLLMQTRLVLEVLYYLSIMPYGPARAYMVIKDAVFNDMASAQVLMSYSALWLQQPWRVLTPIFLHFSILHILFNMYWLYELGSLIEQKEKKGRYALIVLLASVMSNLLQLFIVGPNFGGMSGVVYGLFAYIWLSAKFNPMSGYWIRQDVVYWMLGWFVLCFTGYLGPVANFGHLGGLLAGAVMAGVARAKR